MSNERKFVARWENVSGRWWCELYALNDSGAYSYSGEGLGGVFYAENNGQAIERVEDNYLVLCQPDKNKTHMSRV